MPFQLDFSTLWTQRYFFGVYRFGEKTEYGMTLGTIEFIYGHWLHLSMLIGFIDCNPYRNILLPSITYPLLQINLVFFS